MLLFPAERLWEEEVAPCKIETRGRRSVASMKRVIAELSLTGQAFYCIAAMRLSNSCITPPSRPKSTGIPKMQKRLAIAQALAEDRIMSGLGFSRR